jgi:hypothetical protein
MTHFGIAFGTIVVTVIGGALVLDHYTSSNEKVAARPSPAAQQAQPEPPSTNVAKESAIERPVTLADATPSAPSKAPSPVKKAASASTPSRTGTSASTARLAASVEEAQGSSSDRAPTPAPAPVDVPPAAPKTDEPQEGPKPS